MKLPGHLSRTLSEALRDAFGRKSLRVFLDESLEERFDDIASDSDFKTQIHELLQWAKRHDRVEELFENAVAEVAGNARLQEAQIALRDHLRRSADGSGTTVLQTAGLPPADYLFGRDVLLSVLVEHLCSEDPAPVPILGGPGMGKTALSIHAFRDSKVEARFGARRYFARCETVTGSDALPGAIVSAMGLRPTGDPRVTMLQALTTPEPTLLVLDNLETPWDADLPGVESLLSEIDALPGVVLVVSVRGSVRPQGVRWHSTVEVGKLPAAAAKELFHEISDGAHRNDPDLDEVLALLDGIALAIRLMAHAAAVQPSLRWVLDAWANKRTAMLRRAEGKDDDLEVSIALSIDGPRINDQGRELASFMGFLPEGLAFEDLEVLLPDYGREAASQLVSAGLAFYLASRIQMLLPIRETVGRRVPAKDDQIDAVYRHYLELVRSLGEKIGAEGGVEAAIRLEPEIGNLEAAFHWGLAVDPGASFAARRGLKQLLRFRGVGSLRPIQEAAERAKALERTEDEANCIHSLGDIALRRSDHKGAKTRYQEALVLYRRLDDALGEAKCIQCLGDIALDHSDHDEARVCYDRALPLYRSVGSILGSAGCMKSLGNIALRRSDHDGARACYDEALQQYRRVGDVLGEANCIRSLGDIALDRSDHKGARVRYESALFLHRRVGDFLGEAGCLFRLGDIALRLSNQERARSRYKEALSQYRRVGSVLGEAGCLFRLGDIALRRSDQERARIRYEEALPQYRRVGSILGEAGCLFRLGDMALHRSDYEVARTCYEEAIPQYRRVGSVLGEANCILSLGDIALRRLDHDTARSCFREALPLYRRVGTVFGEANCMRSLGDSLEKKGDWEKAQERWETALTLYRRIPEPFSIGWTHHRLARVAATEAERSRHLEAARDAWASIDRPDLIKKHLDDD